MARHQGWSKKWGWFQWTEHPDEHKNVLGVTITHQRPVQIVHDNHATVLNVNLDLHLHVGVRNIGSAFGPKTRDVSWRRATVNAGLLGQDLTVTFTFPKWQESREQYLHNRDLFQRKSQAVAQALRDQGCMHDTWQFPRRQEYATKQETVGVVGGNLAIITLPGRLHCFDCNKMYYFTEEVMNLVETPLMKE